MKDAILLPFKERPNPRLRYFGEDCLIVKIFGANFFEFKTALMRVKKKKGVRFPLF